MIRGFWGGIPLLFKQNLRWPTGDWGHYRFAQGPYPYLIATVSWKTIPPNLGQLIAIIAIFRVWVPITGTSLAPVARDEDRWKTAHVFGWAKHPFPTFFASKNSFQPWANFWWEKNRPVGILFSGVSCVFSELKKLYSKNDELDHKNAKRLHIICL